MSPEGGFSVARPTSVIPYPSSIGMPASAENSASRRSGTLSAPARHTLSDARSSGVTSWSRTRAVRAAGIIASAVGRWARSSGSTSCAS